MQMRSSFAALALAACVGVLAGPALAVDGQPDSPAAAPAVAAPAAAVTPHKAKVARTAVHRPVHRVASHHRVAAYYYYGQTAGRMVPVPATRPIQVAEGFAPGLAVDV